MHEEYIKIGQRDESVFLKECRVQLVHKQAMRLHHSLDGSTYLGSKLLCFAKTNCFPQRIERVSF